MSKLLNSHQEEADLVLSNTMVPTEKFYGGHRDTAPHQLLKIALMTNNVNFVAHDYTQQSLRWEEASVFDRRD